MLTQCPKCKSVFKIDQQSLQIADGVVECGECSTHFNAIKERIDQNEKQSDTTAHVVETDNNRYQIIDPLADNSNKRSTNSSPLWILGIALLLVIAASQYLLLQKEQLAKNLTIRPVILQLCKFTGCNVPLLSDLSAFEIRENNIETHPSTKNALLITGFLLNRARFEQNFPLVELRMTDLDQQVVSSRKFKVSEYLPKGTTMKTIAANTEVPLLLEIVDPGESAIGFEFKFYRAPAI